MSEASCYQRKLYLFVVKVMGLIETHVLLRYTFFNQAFSVLVSIECFYENSNLSVNNLTCS